MNPVLPNNPGERMKSLDIIRGFALLGILMVNMTFFKFPRSLMELYPSDFPGGPEQAAAWFIQLIATGRFYAIFSFLFGIGFYIFLDRASGKTPNINKLYGRRLGFLLLMGLTHLIFIWSGDILHMYAVGGFILLAVKNIKTEKIPLIGLILFLVALIIYAGIFILLGLAEHFGDWGKAAGQLAAEAVAVYSEGSYGEILLFSLENDVSGAPVVLVVGLPVIMFYFLMGLYAGRKGIFSRTEEHLPFIKKVCITGFLAGSFFSLIFYIIETGIINVHPVLRHGVLQTVNLLAAAPLSFFYVSLLLLLMQNTACLKILSLLAAPGRMALTNYISQSVICVFIFYGFGLGYYGQISLSKGLLLTGIIFAIQIIWSNIWLKHYHYGPLEWLWRAATYGRFFPIRKS